MVSGVVDGDQEGAPSAAVVPFDAAELVLLSLPRRCVAHGGSCASGDCQFVEAMLPYRRRRSVGDTGACRGEGLSSDSERMWRLLLMPS